MGHVRKGQLSEVQARAPIWGHESQKRSLSLSLSLHCPSRAATRYPPSQRSSWLGPRSSGGLDRRRRFVSCCPLTLTSSRHAGQLPISNMAICMIVLVAVGAGCRRGSNPRGEEATGVDAMLRECTRAKAIPQRQRHYRQRNRAKSLPLVS